MTNEILCTIDFSESSKGALKWAVALAKTLNANLTVLHTYRLLPSRNDEAIELKKKMERDFLDRFRALETELLIDRGVTYKFKSEVGFVSNRVKEYSRSGRVGMLVMGNTMNSKSNESFDELAQTLDIPLVIVP